MSTYLHPEKNTVAVIGLGYVGLPLIVEFAAAGFTGIGIDIDRSKVDAVNAGQSYIPDVPGDDVRKLVGAGKLRATTDFAEVGKADAIVICVPTPLRKTKEPDISHILVSCDEIAKHIRRGQLIILESTTYPGTTDEVILPIFERGGLKVGKDFFLAFSPERVDPGNKQFLTKNICKIVGGVTPECTERAVELYRYAVNNVLPTSNARVAETAKLLENTSRSVNIALVNEMAQMCHYLGIDVWEVINAAATKPFGYQAFYPGPGIGGHCIPLDPYYLTWKARVSGYEAKFIALAGEINSNMPHYVLTLIADALNDDGKCIKGSKILILGVAYKKNVSDTRESPAIEIIALLQAKGADVSYADPFVPTFTVNGRACRSVALGDEILRDSDCAVIIANHDAFDYHQIGEHAKLIVDTRNAMVSVEKPRGKVVKL
ncbi:MAG: nucleotide sugar dehydrogenase [Armatimonadetes bacterium]|nr:nucleotide sugar dehydrogenase [Armatimonadota bacterium]